MQNVVFNDNFVYQENNSYPNPVCLMWKSNWLLPDLQDQETKQSLATSWENVEWCEPSWGWAVDQNYFRSALTAHPGGPKRTQNNIESPAGLSSGSWFINKNKIKMDSMEGFKGQNHCWVERTQKLFLFAKKHLNHPRDFWENILWTIVGCHWNIYIFLADYILSYCIKVLI